MAEPFFDTAAIFDNKPDFDAEIIRLFDLDPAETSLPATYSGMLHQRRLAVVSPELYRANYPEGDEPAAFEKLLAHEIAHHLHIRVLGGDEDAMGPVWFYEGFALVAAGQFEGRDVALTPDDRRRIIAESERRSYREYAPLLRHLLKSAPLADMVKRASQPDFNDWALERAG
jgi:hypothetical protein